jgi:diguanylate cyclase (GGDEF)-like protein
MIGENQWRAVRRILGYGGLSMDSVHTISMPVRMGDSRWGHLTVGFSLARLQDTLADLENRILLSFAVAMLVGLFCALFFARSMAATLRSLIDASRAAARGDFSYRVAANAEDEVGELAESYNYMVEALGRSHEQLVERANADGLTGLYNHRYFQERLTAEFARSSRYDHPLSLLMLDIDRFKAFNDEHGHPLGDVVLCDLAAIMVESLLESDISARYGGEEFVVLLPETAVDEAMLIAERLRQSVEKRQFRGVGGLIVPVTVSVGVASYPDHAVGKDQLLKCADIALYKAKSDGRNAVACYSEETMPQPLADPYKLYVLLHANDLKTIEALAGAVDAKYHLPPCYSVTVATAAAQVAREMDMSEDDRAAVYLAALLRDVGQVAIPDSILSKAGALQGAERKQIEQHPVLGHAIIQKSSHLQSVLPAVLHHHERFDGSGYPYGLAGKDIPLAARVISVVDAYQSMISERPHRKQMTPAEALVELDRNAGTQFDPDVVRVFSRMLAAREEAA